MTDIRTPRLIAKRKSIRDADLAIGAAVLAAVLAFTLIYGLRLLNAADPYWRDPHGDMTQMMAGELAGLRAPWSLPLLVVRTLTAPDPISLVYTDSIPWLTALLKASHLGSTVSLLGAFLLLAWVAQAAAMHGLLRALGVTRGFTLFLGSLLALLAPPFLARQLGHTALSGQAFEIAALALAVTAARRGASPRVLAAFVALGVLAAGVHAYHLPPITLMLLAALASDLLQRRAGAVRRAAVGLGGYVIAVAAAAWVLGYGVGRGESGGTAALGFYEMNMLAPGLPQASWLAGQKWDGAWFTPSFDPTGGEAYDGFNYLGAGSLMLLLAALVSMALGARGGATPGRERRWAPLGVSLAVLTLYAIGPQGWLGAWHVWSVPLANPRWAEPLALFRAHGRFFWSVGYLLLALGVVAADRLRPRALGAGLLAAAVALQAIDMSGLLFGLHAQFSRPERLIVPAALDSAAFEGRDYLMFPAFFCATSGASQATIRQLALIAQHRHASTTSAATVRAPVGACDRRPSPDLLTDAPPGDRRLVVVMGDGGATADARPSAVSALFARRTDCFAMEAAWLCGRDLSRVPGLKPAQRDDLATPGPIDADLRIGAPAFAALLLSGWTAPTATGVWSEGPRAVLRLPHLHVAPGGALVVQVEALSYAPGARSPQRVRVSVAGRTLREWTPQGVAYQDLRVSVPAELLSDGRPLELAFDLPDAVAPQSVEPGANDPRKLGIGLRRVLIWRRNAS